MRSARSPSRTQVSRAFFHIRRSYRPFHKGTLRERTSDALPRFVSAPRMRDRHVHQGRRRQLRSALSDAEAKSSRSKNPARRRASVSRHRRGEPASKTIATSYRRDRRIRQRASVRSAQRAARVRSLRRRQRRVDRRSHRARAQAGHRFAAHRAAGIRRPIICASTRTICATASAVVVLSATGKDILHRIATASIRTRST